MSDIRSKPLVAQLHCLGFRVTLIVTLIEWLGKGMAERGEGERQHVFVDGISMQCCCSAASDVYPHPPRPCPPRV